MQKRSEKAFESIQKQSICRCVGWQKWLLDFILQRQRERLEAKELPEPFLLLLPSWTVGKAFFRRFLNELSGLKTTDEEAAGVYFG